MIDKQKARVFIKNLAAGATELNKKKIIFIIVISIIVVFIDFTFLIGLQLRAIKTVTPKIIKLKKDIDMLNKDLATLQNLKAKQAETKQVVPLKVRITISEDQLPLLFQEVSNLANISKVKILQIKPLKDPKAKEEVIADKKFLPLAIALDLSCTYHSLGRFINALENAAQFMMVQEIKITRNPGDYLLENVNLVLKTYVKK